ncbi:MAG: hypothetical protein P4L59_21230 [Desulfosporosinus sp.]|nr:hypothetical protein [Desulfosporosinus sp.]
MAVSQHLLGVEQVNLDDIDNLNGEADRKPTEQSFFVAKSAIEGNDYDLSINKYKEVVYEKVLYDTPQPIMTRLDELSLNIASNSSLTVKRLKLEYSKTLTRMNSGFSHLQPNEFSKNVGQTFQL